MYIFDKSIRENERERKRVKEGEGESEVSKKKEERGREDQNQQKAEQCLVVDKVEAKAEGTEEAKVNETFRQGYHLLKDIKIDINQS